MKMIEGAVMLSVILLFRSENRKPDKSTVEARHTDISRLILNGKVLSQSLQAAEWMLFVLSGMLIK